MFILDLLSQRKPPSFKLLRVGRTLILSKKMKGVQKE